MISPARTIGSELDDYRLTVDIGDHSNTSVWDDYRVYPFKRQTYSLTVVMASLV